MSPSDALRIVCPTCGSRHVSTYDREIETAWSLSLPQLASYRRGGKESFKECKCTDCGKKFRYFPALDETKGSPLDQEQQSELLGKSVRLRLPRGEVVDAKVDGIYASVKLNSDTPSAVIATDQFVVRMKAARFETTGGLMLVLDQNDVPFGILWAGSIDDQGDFLGIVQPIARLSPEILKL